MLIFDETYDNYIADPIIDKYCNRYEAVFFDIETTGLAKEKTDLYLIGCGHYIDNKLVTKFFFADSKNEELDVINAFFEYIKSFKYIIHFNGTKFDLPYIEYKCKKYSVENRLNDMTSIDIYQMIKPLRYLMFPVSMRQKFIEDFLQITRNDMYNGGELIAVYDEYLHTHDNNKLNLLMMHNREDVLGMHKIIPILNYLELLNCNISYISHEENRYKDFYGEDKKELLINGTYDANINLPSAFSSKTETMYLQVNPQNHKIVIRLAISSGNFKMFYDNYRDYYYLPDKDCCIHKSVAMGIDKANKVKATKQTCYEHYDNECVCQPDVIFTPVLKSEYKSKRLYFPYPQAMKIEKMDSFINSLFNLFIRKRDNRA